MRRIRLKLGIAWLVVALFAIQSIVRLIGLSPPFRDQTPRIPIVHAIDLAALSVVALLALRAADGRRPVLVVWALAIATVGLALTAFDFSLLAAVRYNERIVPLSTVTAFYCNDEGLTGCVRAYPSSVAIGAVLLSGWVLLLIMTAQVLTPWVSRLKPLLPACFVAAWLAVWLLHPVSVEAFEPMTRYLTKVEGFTRPVELAKVPRPNWRFAPTPNARPRLLVLITVDSLRADALQLAPDRPSVTPFLQSLAASGKLHDFGPATAMCSSSYCGIVGVLSSSDWATLQRGPPAMLPDVLAANGYASHFLLSGPHRRAQNLVELYGPHVTTLLDDASPDSRGAIDDREQIRRLQSLQLRDPSHSFIFIHLMSAHGAGLRFDANEKPLSWWDRVWKGGRFIGSYPEYYARGVAQADWVLRSLFGVLQSRGLLDQALIVITADHGEGLYKNLGHGHEVNIQTALVPLLVYDPRNGVWPAATGMASNFDAAPTLLTAAGITIPPQWRGTSLQAGVTRAAAPSDDADNTALVGRVGGQLAMVRCERKNGKRVVLAGGQGALEAYAGWAASGLIRRADVAGCR